MKASTYFNLIFIVDAVQSIESRASCTYFQLI